MEWEDLGRTSPDRHPVAQSTDDECGSDDGSDGFSESDEEEDRHWAASEIVPGLWVGRKEDAELPSGLAANSIGLVISVHEEEQTPPVAMGPEQDATPQGVEWCRLRIEDRADSDLLQYFDTVSDRIVEFSRPPNGVGSSRPTGVLVHCLAGQSRSVAIVAAYLMREHGHSLRDLIEWDDSTQTHGNGLMQRARRGVFPNRGLWRQLAAYEATCRGTASYSESELPGSIAFDREAIATIITRFQSRSSTTAASYGAGSTGAAPLKRIADVRRGTVGEIDKEDPACNKRRRR